jgi:hypothetical protein
MRDFDLSPLVPYESRGLERSSYSFLRSGRAQTVPDSKRRLGLRGHWTEGFEHHAGRLRYAPCAQSDDYIAICSLSGGTVDRFLEGGRILDLFTTYGTDQRRSINPGDGFFAGGVDVQDLHCIGLIEGGREFRH